MAGNANSGRRQEKPFADALRMEIAAAGDDHKKLRNIAKVLLEKAEAGDMQAIQMVADRTDGKPAQAVDIDATVQFEDLLAQLK
jgi:hypothetical protein